VYDGEIGYCQGLSFIAAVLLLEVSNRLCKAEFCLVNFKCLLPGCLPYVEDARGTGIQCTGEDHV